MKVFVTGVTGQLGHDVALELIKRGHIAIMSGREDVKAFAEKHPRLVCPNAQIDCGQKALPAVVIHNNCPPYFQLDITDKTAVAEAMETIKPDAVIHCAAWTAVDAAEDEKNRNQVHSINADGTRFIAEAAKAADAKMLYLSTDYVFDGSGSRPWQPDDRNYAPLNYYGVTKLLGEEAVSSTLAEFFIVRIAWVFGLNGKNFVNTMIHVGKTHDAVRVVNDQIGTPTYTPDLSRLLIDMVESKKYGYYHVTNEGGYISWYDFCREFYRQYSLSTRVIPVTTEEYGLSKAARPKNSRLDKSKLAAAGFRPLPDWKDAVARYLKEAKL